MILHTKPLSLHRDLKFFIMTQDINVSVTLTPRLRLEQALKKAGIDDPATVAEMGEEASPVSFEKKNSSVCV